MAAPRIVIVTPAPPRSRAGNRNTALRWAGILRDLGYRTRVVTQWRGETCELLIALHARRGHAALRDFSAAHPTRPTILALTGTDIYRDIHTSTSAQHSLELATRLVVLQDQAPKELTQAQRRRTHVIYQSTVVSHPWRPPRRVFRVCVLGHLRDEKDPFRLVLALRHVPEGARIEAVQAGAALSAEMESAARAHMRDEPRYRWRGELAHWRAMRLLARSHAMVISSRMEGGAHVVCEAIACGVPVIASDISGNRGMLGADYEGCYAPNNEAALAGVVDKAMRKPGFLARLEQQVVARRSLVDPRREAAAWRALLGELKVTPG